MNIKKVSINDLYENTDMSSIRNFILSDHIKEKPDLSFKDFVISDGAIFGLCIRGKGKIKINFREYDITPNTLMVVTPNQIVKLIEKSDDLVMELLFFSFDFVTGLPFQRNLDVLLNIGKHPCVEISEEKRQDLLEMHAFIVKKYNNINHTYRKPIAIALLYALILEVSSIYSDVKVWERESSSRQEELANKFFKLLMVHYKEERSVAFYADKMCLTTKYLSSTIKKATGESVLTWINRALIAEAKVQLRTAGNMSIAQISEQMHFPNPSFFGRFFKDHTGMTPLRYRKGESADTTKEEKDTL